MTTPGPNREPTTAARPVAVEAHSLCMDYGHRRVLRNLSFCIGEGEIVELRGGNGSGKSTLLACLAAGVRPTVGRVAWFGQPAADRPAQRRWIGVLAHESRLYPHLTLRENLMFVARLCHVDRPGERVDEMLDETGLADRAHYTPSQISRGMRQRLSIARALVHRPRIVLLDEPFSGLDTAGRAWLLDRFDRARRDGQTLCLATHEREGSLPACDRVLVLRNGRLSETASPTAQSPTDSAHAGIRRVAA